MKIEPIGIIYSPYNDKKQVPIQPAKSRARGRVKVFRKYVKGLQNIEGFSHVILIYRFHKSRGYSLTVTPFLGRKPKGLYATCYCRRPNQLGLSIVRLVRRKGSVLYIHNIDVVNKTPLLDIRPFVPDFYAPGKVKIGWLSGRIK
jgi:tRNA-Thr(GGU) m(6)t(6)A37 methyltransferase TsaA